MNGARRGLLWAVAAAAAFVAAGCRSEFGAAHQQALAERYYGGDVEGAAKYAAAISDAERNETTRSALLWHLEAGNTNLDAGDHTESMRCLNRAEKLIYLIDGTSPRFHRPGLPTYRGTHSDRLLLHLLKGFNYLADGKVEDFLVEIRRLRAEQFRYVLDEADPEVRMYETAHFGSAGVPTMAMGKILGDRDKSAIFGASGLSGEFTEYSRRRRPMLPLLYNPLGFYLSALGYAIDNEYEEAVIDFRYLLMLDPENKLYRQDCAALITALGDKLPDELRNVEKTAVPADGTVCFIVARGCPEPWESRRVVYLVPGHVPTDWSFSYPVYRPVSDPGFSVRCGDAVLATGSHLVDLSEILSEEYWQYVFPGMVERAYAATLAMTVAHRSAQASLATALAMPNNEFKSLAVASARLAVAATSRAAWRELEWRRWVTVPRCYSVAHVQLPPGGSSRKMTLVVNFADGAPASFELDFSPETNRAVVYLRDLGQGNHVLKNWESME